MDKNTISFKDAVGLAFEEGYFKVVDDDFEKPANSFDECDGVHIYVSDGGGFYAFNKADEFDTAEEFIDQLGEDTVYQEVAEVIQDMCNDPTGFNFEEGCNYVIEILDIVHEKGYGTMSFEGFDAFKDEQEFHEQIYSEDIEH